MKILFVSLGCDKNLVDTEYMLGILGNEGYAFTDDEQEADIIVINTCCFINDAKEESINTILEMAEYRESGNCKALIVTGCLAQRYQEEIEKEIPQVDAILGTNSYDAIAEAVKNVLGGSHYEQFQDIRRNSKRFRKAFLNHRWSLCPFKNCRRLQQALYLLHHSKNPWRIPQYSNRRISGVRKGFSGTGRKGIDFGRTGNHSLRYRPVWREISVQTFR